MLCERSYDPLKDAVEGDEGGVRVGHYPLGHLRRGVIIHFLCRVSNFAQTPTGNGRWVRTSGALLHPRMK
jgi:hypothetical protein